MAPPCGGLLLLELRYFPFVVYPAHPDPCNYIYTHSHQTPVNLIPFCSFWFLNKVMEYSNETERTIADN